MNINIKQRYTQAMQNALHDLLLFSFELSCTTTKSNNYILKWLLPSEIHLQLFLHFCFDTFFLIILCTSNARMILSNSCDAFPWSIQLLCWGDLQKSDPDSASCGFRCWRGRCFKVWDQSVVRMQSFELREGCTPSYQETRYQIGCEGKFNANQGHWYSMDLPTWLVFLATE